MKNKIIYQDIYKIVDIVKQAITSLEEETYLINGGIGEQEKDNLKYALSYLDYGYKEIEKFLFEIGFYTYERGNIKNINQIREYLKKKYVDNSSNQ